MFCPSPIIIHAESWPRFEVNIGIIAACVPLLKPLLKYIKLRYWKQDFSERLHSDENLSKQTGLFGRMWRNRGHMESSHGAHEPEDFNSYVRYIKERHRRKRAPLNTVIPNSTLAPVFEPAMTMAPGRPPSLARPKRPPNTTRLSTHNPVMDMGQARSSSVEKVPSVRRPSTAASEPSLHLPLHGVPEIPGTNRYSTTDPIQELKGIVANHSFDEEMGR